ncbi:glycosyl hydrolase [Myxococcota bacterium]
MFSADCRSCCGLFSPSADEITDEGEYLWRYPGDDYVDVLGLDSYYWNDSSRLVRVLEWVVAQAEKKAKVPALTEFGARNGLGSAWIAGDVWFSRGFLTPVMASPSASRIAYALAWRNASRQHFFVPYPGHAGESGFRDFCHDPRVLLQSDLPL